MSALVGGRSRRKGYCTAEMAERADSIGNRGRFERLLRVAGAQWSSRDVPGADGCSSGLDLELPVQVQAQVRWVGSWVLDNPPWGPGAWQVGLRWPLAACGGDVINRKPGYY